MWVKSSGVAGRPVRSLDLGADVGAHLEHGRTERPVEDLNAVEAGLLRDTVDLGEALNDFSV